MNPDDAQSALDELRRRRDQSRAAYLRFGRSRTPMLLSAAIVLLSFASFDLPNPWGGAMIFPAMALIAALLVTYLRRSPVRRPVTTREAAFATAAGLALVAAFRGLAEGARAGGLPAPHTAAAALLCVAGLLGMVLAGRRRS
jgi:hypothetical protein